MFTGRDFYIELEVLIQLLCYVTFDSSIFIFVSVEVFCLQSCNILKKIMSDIFSDYRNVSFFALLFYQDIEMLPFVLQGTLSLNLEQYLIMFTSLNFDFLVQLTILLISEFL